MCLSLFNTSPLNKNKHFLNYANTLKHTQDVPVNQRIDLATFCTLAALSERVVSLEPVLKRLINKIDIEAFDVKINKSKVKRNVVVVTSNIIMLLLLLPIAMRRL